MPRFSMIAGVGLVLAALAGGIVVQQHRLDWREQRVTELALAEANRAAAVDSTREIGSQHRELDALLGDSLKLVERLVTQRTQERDAVDRSLGRERIARYRVSAKVDSLQSVVFKTAAATIDSTQTVRRATFALRQPPYTVSAKVVMPPQPDSASLALDVALDSIVLDARVSCAPPNRDGVRAASLSATAPAWASVRFGRLEQTAELCNAPRKRAHSRVGLLPLVIGAGRVFDNSARGTWGLFVGAGYGFKL